MYTDVDVVVIGAGQAGLATAHELRRRGVERFVVLDAGAGPGGAWRERWDSLTLGRAHGIADLPGLPMRRPDPSVPASRLVADYYGAYERRFALPVLRPVRVRSVESIDDVLVVTAAGGARWRARVVVNATGTWTRPFVPHLPGLGKFRGKVLHTVDYTRAADFAGARTVVVGGGLSAVQFLLELAEVTGTVWSTRTPPRFTARPFDLAWGRDVEARVRADTAAGRAPRPVVENTGIPSRPEYLEGVAAGTLVSRGPLARATAHGVVFGEPRDVVKQELVVPESWAPEPGPVDADVIFFNTGFRPALGHLAPLRLRGPGGGIRMRDEVTPEREPRVLLAGYGSTASTVGATRAGRTAGRAAAKLLTCQL